MQTERKIFSSVKAFPSHLLLLLLLLLPADGSHCVHNTVRLYTGGNRAVIDAKPINGGDTLFSNQIFKIKCLARLGCEIPTTRTSFGHFHILCVESAISL